MVNHFFELLGEFLADQLQLVYRGKGNPGLEQDLMSLSSGKKSVVRTYYVKKIRKLCIIFFCGLLLSVACFITYLFREQWISVSVLDRPDYGGGDRKESLMVQVEGRDEKVPVEVAIQERHYTEKEKQDFLHQAILELDQCIAGENASLSEVRTALIFPETMLDGKVSVSWNTMPYGIIGSDGSICSPDALDGTEVEIHADLFCEEQEMSYETFATVYPPEVSEEEAFCQKIRQKVQDADQKERILPTLTLPDSVEGTALTWGRQKKNPVPWIIVLTLLAGSFAYVQMDSSVHEKAEERRRQLLLDYPNLMWKMTMLLGAGLTIKGTFVRISEEYRREKELAAKRKKPSIRYVYEEVCFTCYEMESGISEAQAYERFGKRCQLPEYIRLGSVLSQNLRKGAKGLTETLQEEAELSMNDRKNHARKIGEQAGTKLLLPMILMLGIVLVILMVPAFLSF